jgi:two-component system cell cycle sensor histidine kinase/response regulator CckA
MPQGGKLRLRAENCVLGEEEAKRFPEGRPGAWVVLQVDDTGTGIAPEVLEHLFEPFFTTKPADKGTGLGLNTVRGIVNTHLGFIQLETAVGHGTSFRVFLPATGSVAIGEGRTADQPAARGAGELILVVDDEETIRSVAAAILTEAGYRVLTAADGNEAIAKFMPHATEVALVISDLDMPNLNGAGLAQALHQMKPELKILAISGLTGTSRNSAVRPEEFAAGFLEKPFAIGALLNLVHCLLQPDTAKQP